MRHGRGGRGVRREGVQKREKSHVTMWNHQGGSIGVFPRIGGFPPKMDGENHGNLIKMDDLGVALFSETPIVAFEQINKNKLIMTQND